MKSKGKIERFFLLFTLFDDTCNSARVLKIESRGNKRKLIFYRKKKKRLVQVYVNVCSITHTCNACNVRLFVCLFIIELLMQLCEDQTNRIWWPKHFCQRRAICFQWMNFTWISRMVKCRTSFMFLFWSFFSRFVFLLNCDLFVSLHWDF